MRTTGSGGQTEAPVSAVPASGAQYALECDGCSAQVASVGATLRELRFEGRDLVAPFPADAVRPEMRGALLAPWPNRVADGRYRFEGAEHRLALSDPATATAIHGLAAWTDFSCVRRSSDRVLLRGRIEPQEGYPWRIRLDVGFQLGPDGLAQRITAVNESTSAAPFGMGVHPYAVAGEAREGAVEEWTLSLDASHVMLGSDRALPVGLVPLGERPDLDFRAPRRIGETVLNHAWTGLPAGARARLTGPDGHGVEVAWDQEVPWVQLYTADQAAPGGRRASVAIEPMTCPPDALRSGTDLRILAPGETTALEWRIRAV